LEAKIRDFIENFFKFLYNKKMEIKMKRVLFASFLAVLLLFSFSVNGFARERLMISISGNYLLPSDKNFKNIYGKGLFYPELKAGVKVFKGSYLWVGYGAFSVRGTTPILGREAKSDQTFLSGGAGYILHITKKFDCKIELGLFHVSYKEKSMGEELSDYAIGFRIDSGVIFNLGRIFYVEISLGYLNASDTIDDSPVKLGGFRTGMGLGVKF
jgi:hypothetical protein